MVMASQMVGTSFVNNCDIYSYILFVIQQNRTDPLYVIVVAPLARVRPNWSPSAHTEKIKADGDID
jgi:hypothetical protein